MKRQHGWMAFALILFVTACSNKSTAPVPVDRAPESTQDQTSTTNTGTNFNYDTASTNNSNLWDTTTKNDTPAASTSPSPSPSPSSNTSSSSGYQYPPGWNCLTGNTASTQTASTSTNGSSPPWYTTQTNTMPRACFDSSWGGFFGNDLLFDAGIGSFGAMQSCYHIVMSRAPQYCSAGYDVNQVFQMSQMALVRCFRHILRQQMALVHWAQPQVQSYQQNDSSLFLLLTLFSQQQ